MQVKHEKGNIAGLELKLVQRENLCIWKKIVISSAIVLLYLYIGLKNYLFFHSLIEILGIFIGFGVAIAVYHSSRIMKNGIYLYLGALFLFTSIFQIFHVFSYAGINILSSDSYDLSVQISVIGKFLDAIALLVMLVIPADTIKKNLSSKRLLIPYTVVSIFLLSTIYFGIFPQCAYDNADSSPFKILCEFILLCLYTFLLFICYKKRHNFGENLFVYVFSYIVLRLLSEVLFVSAQQVTDLATILAHMLRFFSLCVIYKAVSIGVIIKPISILFRELDRKNRELEQKTIELEAVNKSLMHEVKECMRIEELLRKSEERYRNLLEFMPDAVLLHDREKILFVNKAGVELFGFEDNSEVLSKSLYELLDENNFNEYKLKMSEADNCEFPIIFEEILRRDSQDFCIEVITTSYNIDNKTVFLSVIRDITQRKEFEEMKHSVDESKRLLQEVTEMDKLKTDYIVNLSHEFRTPLSIILCTLKIMESLTDSNSSVKIDKEKLNKYISIMKNNSYKLLKTANNLLEISKIESGCEKLRFRNCNIVRIVEKVTMSVWSYTRNRQINLMFDTDTEEIVTACDVDKIERIILNLLSNAIKFTEEGGQIKVNVCNKKTEVLITVSDTGIGIPKDKFSLIFERFKQVDNSLTRVHEGTGIGLALVKSFVEMHDGRIEVESEVGVGSTFKIFLPVRILSNEAYLDYNETEAEIEKRIEENINIELSNI